MRKQVFNIFVFFVVDNFISVRIELIGVASVLKEYSISVALSWVNPGLSKHAWTSYSKNLQSGLFERALKTSSSRNCLLHICIFNPLTLKVGFRRYAGDDFLLPFSL